MSRAPRHAACQGGGSPRRSASRLLTRWAWPLCAAWLLGTPRADAQPSVWSMAREPSLKQQGDTMREVERLFQDYRQARRRSPLSDATRQLVLRDARQRLERIGAHRSPAPVLRHYLARVLYGLYELDGNADHLRHAAVHLDAVVRTTSSVTIRAEALNDLAMCHARLGDHRKEVAAYDRALAVEPHAEARAVLLANQAEGIMAQGDITGAVAGYRASLTATPAYALHRLAVTTWWGLAVSLDRSGDLSGALEQIRIARSYDPEDLRLQSDSWVFLPDYDKHWYHALGHWLAARQATQRLERLEAYERATLAWSAYLQHAPPDDHWVAMAGHRHNQCEVEYRRALTRPSR